MWFSEIKVKEIKRLVSLGPWHLPFRTGTFRSSLLQVPRSRVVNSDRVYQNIITHPWGAKGAKVRGWVIVVSTTNTWFLFYRLS